MVLIVSADACMQGVQGSNPTGDLKVVRRSTAFFAVEFKVTSKGTREGACVFFIVNNFGSIQKNAVQFSKSFLFNAHTLA